MSDAIPPPKPGPNDSEGRLAVAPKRFSSTHTTLELDSWDALPTDHDRILSLRNTSVKLREVYQELTNRVTANEARVATLERRKPYVVAEGAPWPPVRFLGVLVGLVVAFLAGLELGWLVRGIHP